MADVSGGADGLYYGSVVSLVLFGITVSQGWIYLHNNDDKWPLRLHILLLMLLNIAETCCVILSLHHYLIANFGNLEILSLPARTLDIAVLVSGFLFFFVHLFFATRIYFLSKAWWIPGIIICLSMTEFIINTHVVAVPRLFSRFSDFRSKVLKTEVSIIHILKVVTDLIVTFSLLYFLSRLKTEFSTTQKVLYKLYKFCITRGLLVTTLQVVHLIMYFVNPGNVLFWISPHLILGKLYIVTMFVMLNSRTSLRNDMTDRPTAQGTVKFVCLDPGGSSPESSVRGSSSFEPPTPTAPNAVQSKIQ